MNLIDKSKLQYALTTPFLDDEEALKRFRADMALAVKGDEAANKKISDKLGEAFGLWTKAVKGYNIKGFSTITGGQAPNYRIATNLAWNDELEMDTEWMNVYRFSASTGRMRAEVVDFVSTVVVQLHKDGEKIKMSPVGSDSTVFIDEKRWATGLTFFNRWLETNDLYTINDFINGVRIAFQTNRTNQAYTALAAVTAGATTTATAATVDAVITAINTGAKTLLSRMSQKGLNISKNAPLVAICSMDHEDLISQAMSRIKGTSGDNNIIRRNIYWGFTFNSNWPATFGGKNAFRLFLPGQKNVWHEFKGRTEQMTKDFSTDSLVFESQEYWGNREETNQCQVVNLQA